MFNLERSTYVIIPRSSFLLLQKLDKLDAFYHSSCFNWNDTHKRLIEDLLTRLFNSSLENKKLKFTSNQKSSNNYQLAILVHKTTTEEIYNKNPHSAFLIRRKV